MLQLRRVKILWISIFLVYSCLAIQASESHDPVLIKKLAISMSRELEQDDRFDAQVWLVSTEARLKRYVGDERERMLILHSTYREAH